MAEQGESATLGTKSLVERLGFLIGVIGPLITLVLTVVNTYTKYQIDAQESRLKNLELTLRERTTGIEESKERVERYKWVLTLLPSLTEEDVTNRNFTVALVRLALTREEAEQLFASLQALPNQELKQVGQQGLTSIENQELNRLVLQMNANSADERISAVQRLQDKYHSSSTAISLVLDLYSPERLSALSPSGIINGLVYLQQTDPEAWTAQNRKAAREVLARISAEGPGPRTKEVINNLEQFLDALEHPNAQ